MVIRRTFLPRGLSSLNGFRTFVSPQKFFYYRLYLKYSSTFLFSSSYSPYILVKFPHCHPLIPLQSSNCFIDLHYRLSTVLEGSGSLKTCLLHLPPFPLLFYYHLQCVLVLLLFLFQRILLNLFLYPSNLILGEDEVSIGLFQPSLQIPIH